MQNNVQIIQLLDAKAQVIKQVMVPAGAGSRQYFIRRQRGENVRVKPSVKL